MISILNTLVEVNFGSVLTVYLQIMFDCLLLCLELRFVSCQFLPIALVFLLFGVIGTLVTSKRVQENKLLLYQADHPLMHFRLLVLACLPLDLAEPLFGVVVGLLM